MGYQVITVPAPGQSDSYALQGQSILIVQAPAYLDVNTAPKLSFDRPGDEIPMFNSGKWPKFGVPFSNIIVTGTAESAGDEIQLISTDICVDPDPGNAGENLLSVPGTTTVKPATDNSFTQAELIDSEGRLPNRLEIFVLGDGASTRGINFAFNTAPTQGFPPTDSYYWDNTPGHETPDSPVPEEPLEIVGIDWMLSMQFLPAVNGEVVNLIWTPDY